MSAALKPMKECPYYKGMGFYTSDSNFDPAVEWPGTTWQKLEGVFILAASSEHPVGENGGEETHTHGLSTGFANVFLSNESWNVLGQMVDAPSWPCTIRIKTASGQAETGTHVNKAIKLQGNTASGSNMPPYISRIYWERIA